MLSLAIRIFLITALLIVPISSGAFAATSETVNVAFRIPLTMGLDIDKYNIDAGNVNLYDEVWTPVSDSTSFKVFVQNNSGSNWDLTIKMPDDLRRIEGVSDPSKDVIKTSDIYWNVVYAGYWDSTVMPDGVQRQAKNTGDSFPGLNNTIQASARTDSSGKPAAGIPFTYTDNQVFNSAAFYSSNTFGSQNGKSYKFQFGFKFIIVPPVNTTAGDYNGTIVFTMRSQ